MTDPLYAIGLYMFLLGVAGWTIAYLLINWDDS